MLNRLANMDNNSKSFGIKDIEAYKYWHNKVSQSVT